MDFVINIYFLFEFVRRFFFQDSLMLLLLPEILITAFGLYKLVVKKVYLDLPYVAVAFFVLVFIGMIASIFVAQISPLFLLLSLRGFIVCAFAVVISLNPKRKQTINWFLFWNIVCLLVASAQIFLGPEHPFSRVASLKYGSIQVFNDAEYDYGSFFWFRPTSIFMHVGKYGQMSFALFCVFWGALVANWKDKKFILGVVVAIANLLVSGQRSGVILAALVVLCTLFVLKRSAYKFSTFIFVVSLLLVLLFAFLPEGTGSKVGGSIYHRYLETSSEEIRSRANSQIVEGFRLIFDKYSFSGEGAGVLSIGAQRLNIDPDVVQKSILEKAGTYDVVLEGSYIRMALESGAITMIFFIGFWLSIVVAGIVRVRKSIRSYILGLSILAAMIWAFTHDILGNTPVVSILLVGFAEFFHKRGPANNYLGGGGAG
jgi:hypothetical protein